MEVLLQTHEMLFTVLFSTRAKKTMLN